MSQPRIPGTLPTDIRNRVVNPDGSVSTVKTISIGTDQGEVLIPTIVGDRALSEQEAIDHFRRTNEHFGVFASPEEATHYAEKLHNKHAQLLELSKIFERRK